MINLIIVTGMYGSGKSEFTLQYALYLKQQKNCNVYIGDLDVVNVYFRSREQEQLLNQNNITLLGNVLGSDVNTDVPHFSPNFYQALNDKDSYLILDLAGSEVGLRMIPAFIYDLVKRNEMKYEFLYLFNAFREENENVEQLQEVVEYINNYSKIKLTGIINNSHLMEYTTNDDVLSGQKIIENSNLDFDIKYTLVKTELNSNKLKGEIIAFDKLLLKKQWD